MSRELIHGRHRTVIPKKNNCPVTQVVSTEKVLWVLDFNFFKSVSNVKVSWNVPTSRNTRLVFGNFSRPSETHFITNIASFIREFPNLFCIFRLVDVFLVVDVREERAAKMFREALNGTSTSPNMTSTQISKSVSKHSRTYFSYFA